MEFNKWIIIIFMMFGFFIYFKILNTNKNITYVSGYWSVDNKHGDIFNDWFKNTLNVDENYVIYCNNNDLQLLKLNREKFKNKTIFKNKDINEFYTNTLNINNKTNSIHVPSKELGLIWLEKINLLYETSLENPYNSDWFCWIDAGISSLRNKVIENPVTITNNIIHLLDKNKINYSTSENNEVNTDWYNYKHNLAGGMFIIHKEKVEYYRNIFYEYLIDCIDNCNDYPCYSDQIIWSKIKLNYPDYFHKLCDGYGCMIDII